MTAPWKHAARSVFALCLSLLLACTTTGGDSPARFKNETSEQDELSIIVGGEEILVPVYPGFSNADAADPVVSEMLAIMSPGSSRVEAVFVTREDAAKLFDGAMPIFSRFMDVRVMPVFENTEIDVEWFRNYVDKQKTLFRDFGTQWIQERWSNHIADFLDELNQYIGTSMEIEIGKPVIVDTLFDQDDAYGFLTVTRLEYQEEGVRTSEATVRSGASIMVGNRLILVGVESSFRDQADVDWVIEVSRQWVNSILRKNPSRQKAVDNRVLTDEQKELDRGIKAYHSGLPQLALEVLKPLAEQGNAVAQLYLGYMHASGRGVPRNDTDAFKWFRRSAVQGNASAQDILGWHYANGLGVDQDYEAAFEWYRAAAIQGNVRAQSSLALAYAYGDGVPVDDVRSLMWYRIANMNGYEPAAVSIRAAKQYMSPEQIKEAESKVLKCLLSRYQDC